MRIGLRDILGLADFEQNLDGTFRAGRRLPAIRARSRACANTNVKTPPFVIIGLGKLGGAEINYGSDLDIIFVADDQGEGDLPKLQTIAVEVMDLLSSRTELGIAFRHRRAAAAGRREGFARQHARGAQEYYRKRAQLWEIQSLTRTRSIAGDVKVGKQFQTWLDPDQLQQSIFRSRHLLHWKKEIAHMRSASKKERTPPGKEALAIKTGAGGLIDAEFIAQGFVSNTAGTKRTRWLPCTRAKDKVLTTRMPMS